MPRMPVLFIGHGSPMNAIEQNDFTTAWVRVAKQIPKPKAILCISAHWLREGSAVTAAEKPKTIHDFYGFPPELYRSHYRAPGAPALAKKIAKIVKTTHIALDHEWGLDHGTWSVLAQMYPEADIPVLQLSLDYELSPEKMLALGKELAPLRSQDVLIIGSGNIVHNLARMNMTAKPFGFAVEFDAFVRNALAKPERLIAYASQPSAAFAHPTIDHYLPLLYVAGAAGNDPAESICSGIVMGSVSMRAVAWGLPKKAK